jgi:probable rRNA maturation factor
MTRESGPARRSTAARGRAPGRKSRGRSGGVATAESRSPARFAISVRDEQAHLSVSAARIRKIARLVLTTEEVAGATISIALVDNRTIHALNRKHLNHDYETDVLSFLFDSDAETTAVATAPRTPRGKNLCIDGEIVISAEMAVQAAPRFDWGAADELALYLVHGLLHLCGYDDQTEGERRLMRKRERAILKLLGD